MTQITSFIVGTTTERNTLTPVSGDIFMNTTTRTFQKYNGSSWDDILNSQGPVVGLPVQETTSGSYTMGTNTDYAVTLNVATSSSITLPVGVAGLTVITSPYTGDINTTLHTQGSDKFENNSSSYVMDSTNEDTVWIFNSGVWYGIGFL